MRIAVISDLHLGRRDAADAFGHEERAFLCFLRFLESNFERIVLLGDIWETLTPPCPGQHEAELAAARAAHPALARRFERPQYHYVHGNHDLVAHRVLGVPELRVMEADGVRLLFTHGHAHDWLIRHARWASEAAVWAGAWLRRLGLSSLFEALDTLDEALRGAQDDPRRCSFQRWALKRATLHAADIVVTGHTHRATRAHHGSRLFLNSGTCSGGHLSFLSLDTATHRYELHSRW